MPLGWNNIVSSQKYVSCLWLACLYPVLQIKRRTGGPQKTGSMKVKTLVPLSAKCQALQSKASKQSSMCPV